MTELLSLKIVAVVLVLIVALLSAWMPFRRCKQNAEGRGNPFPIGEALASGVFLGAALMHMLTDANEGFLSAGIGYPLAALLCGVVFLLLIYLEHVGKECRHHQASHNTIAIIAVIMLSIHAFLAGAALGLGQHVSATLIILLAILAHKWAASFSLAVTINQSKLKPGVRKLCFLIFAIMTPVGILFGAEVSVFTSGQNLLAPIFAALAAGTFLYIGTLHGAVRSMLVKQCCNLREFSFVVVGFAIMAVVAGWT